MMRMMYNGDNEKSIFLFDVQQADCTYPIVLFASA